MFGTPIASLLVKVGADLSDLKKDMQSAQQTIAGAAKAFAGLWAVQEIGQAVRATMDYAGQISDLSQRVGVGVEDLQRYEYAAGQVGIELTQLTGIFTALGQRIAGGSNDVRSALRFLGLEFDAIRGMNAEEQFRTIKQRMDELGDSAEMDAAKLALFGKQGAAAVEQLGDTFLETADKAATMSADTIERLDDLGDQLQTIGRDAKVFFAEGLVGAITLARGVVYGFVEGLAGMVESVSSKMLAFAETARAWGGSWAGVGTEAQIAGLRSLVDLTQEWGNAAKIANAENYSSADALKKHGDQVAYVSGNYPDLIKGIDEADKRAKELKAITDSLFGVDAITKATNYVEALGDLSNLSKLTASGFTEMQTTLTAAIDPMNRLGLASSSTAAQIRGVLDAMKAMKAIQGGIEGQAPTMGLGGLGEIGTPLAPEQMPLTPNVIQAQWDQFFAEQEQQWAAQDAAAQASIDATTSAATGSAAEITAANASMQQAAAMGWSGFAVSAGNAIGSATEDLTRFRVSAVETMTTIEQLMKAKTARESLEAAMGGWIIGPQQQARQTWKAGAGWQTEFPWGGAFQTGGVGDFGAGSLAMLHGREAIVPLDKAGALGGVSVTVNAQGAFFDTPASAANLAARVGDAVVERMRQKGVRL